MKNYIIANLNSKFGYDFVQVDENGQETLRKEITSKTGDGYFHLPVIVNGRKLCKMSYLDGRAEFCLDDLPEKSIRTKSEGVTVKKTKVDLSAYYTDDEKTKIAELQAQIDAINADVAARAKQAIEQEKLKTMLKALDPETLKSIVASLA